MRNGQRIVSLISEIREKSNKLIIDELKRNNIHGLVPSHGAILVQLYKKDSLCMKDIAQIIGKDKSTVTALVNKLVKLGYIEKVKDHEDCRITHLKLTEQGWAIEKTFYTISDDLMNRLYMGFDDEYIRLLTKGLEKLSENL